MHIVVTGANGFIGRHLLATLLSKTQLARHAAPRITAVDLQLDQIPEHAVLQKIPVNFANDPVAAIGRYTNNADINSLVTWQADPFVQTNFGSYPPLQVPLAEALGFRNDKELDLLVADALA